MEFRKNYTLSQNDYLTYNLYSHRKQLMLVPAVFFVLMMLACLFVVLSDSSPDPVLLIIVILLVTLFAGLIALSNVLSLNRMAKSQYLSSHALKSAFELVIDENGVRETGSGGCTNADWAHVYRAVESRKAYYIHVTELQAFVIPKHLLDAQEEAAARALLAAHVEPKKCRIKR